MARSPRRGSRCSAHGQDGCRRPTQCSPGLSEPRVPVLPIALRNVRTPEPRNVRTGTRDKPRRLGVPMGMYGTSCLLQRPKAHISCPPYIHFSYLKRVDNEWVKRFNGAAKGFLAGGRSCACAGFRATCSFLAPVAPPQVGAGCDLLRNSCSAVAFPGLPRGVGSIDACAVGYFVVRAWPEFLFSAYPCTRTTAAAIRPAGPPLRTRGGTTDEQG